jgi:hypothetical protein
MNLAQLSDASLEFLQENRDRILSEWKQLALAKWNVRHAQHSFLGDSGAVRNPDTPRDNSSTISRLVETLYDHWTKILMDASDTTFPHRGQPPAYVPEGPQLTLTYLMDLLLMGKEALSEILLRRTLIHVSLDDSDAALIYDRLVEGFAILLERNTQHFCVRCLHPIQEAKEHLQQLKQQLESQTHDCT